MKKFLALAPLLLLASPASAQQGSYEGLVQSHAAANGIPASLVHRVIMRESRYNPRAVGRGGAMGMMQIKLATARGMGYTGSAQGLLDANTNMTYAVKYLAGAYRVAGGNHDRAVGYYASGYYYAAKRRGMAGATTAQPAQVAQVELPNPLAAFAMDTTPQRLTRAERRAQMRGVPSQPVTSTQAP